jgi:hypothetical protein
MHPSSCREFETNHDFSERNLVQKHYARLLKGVVKKEWLSVIIWKRKTVL